MRLPLPRPTGFPLLLLWCVRALNFIAHRVQHSGQLVDFSSKLLSDANGVAIAAGVLPTICVCVSCTKYGLFSLSRREVGLQYRVQDTQIQSPRQHLKILLNYSNDVVSCEFDQFAVDSHRCKLRTTSTAHFLGLRVGFISRLITSC